MISSVLDCARLGLDSCLCSEDFRGWDVSNSTRDFPSISGEYSSYIAHHQGCRVRWGNFKFEMKIRETWEGVLNQNEGLQGPILIYMFTMSSL